MISEGRIMAGYWFQKTSVHVTVQDDGGARLLFDGADFVYAPAGLNGVRLRISGLRPDDRLTLADGIVVRDGLVYFDKKPVGMIEGGQGGDFELAFLPGATSVVVQDLIQSVLYSNASWGERHDLKVSLTDRHGAVVGRITSPYIAEVVTVASPFLGLTADMAPLDDTVFFEDADEDTDVVDSGYGLFSSFYQAEMAVLPYLADQASSRPMQASMG
jgi:hypothetical protein